jgi:hypothetical protein
MGQRSRRATVFAVLLLTTALAGFGLQAVVGAPADRRKLADGTYIFLRRVELRWMGRGRDPEMFLHTQRDFERRAGWYGTPAYTRVSVSDGQGRRYQVVRTPKYEGIAWSGPWPPRHMQERWHVVGAPPARTPLLVTVVPDPEVERVGKFRPTKGMTATFRLPNTPEQRELWARNGKNPQ